MQMVKSGTKKIYKVGFVKESVEIWHNYIVIAKLLLSTQGYTLRNFIETLTN